MRAIVHIICSTKPPFRYGYLCLTSGAAETEFVDHSDAKAHDPTNDRPVQPSTPIDRCQNHLKNHS